MFIEVPKKGKNILAGVLYRRPGSNLDDFFLYLNELVEKIAHENKICYVMGDFNLDLLRWSSYPAVSRLISLFSSSNFYCTVNKPTRSVGASASIIDHVWTNNGHNLVSSKIVFERISDHFPVISYFKTLNNNLSNNNNVSKSTLIKYRDFSEINISNFKNDLDNVCWNLIFVAVNSEIAYNNFITIFDALYNKNFPLIEKEIKDKHLNKPFITNNLKNLIRQKNILQRKYSKYPITYERSYKEIRNKVAKDIKDFKIEYYSEKFTENSKDVIDRGPGVVFVQRSRISLDTFFHQYTS